MTKRRKRGLAVLVGVVAAVGALLYVVTGRGESGRQPPAATVVDGDAPEAVTATAKAVAAQPSVERMVDGLERGIQHERDEVALLELENAYNATRPLATAGTPLPDEYKPFRENNARYMREVLAPRVRECWHGVQGDGQIRTQHTFRVVDGVAIAGPIDESTDYAVTVHESDLPEGEDDVALDCLRSAAEGTSFPYVPLYEDSPSGTITLFQVWPSPQRIERERSSRPPEGD